MSSFFQEITIGGKVYSSPEQLVVLKTELENQLQQKRVEAGQAVDQTLKTIEALNHKEQEAQASVGTAECQLKKAQESLKFIEEQRSIIGDSVTASKKEIDTELKVLVDIKDAMYKAEKTLAAKKLACRVVEEKWKQNEDSLTDRRSNVMRQERSKKMSVDFLTQVKAEKAEFMKTITPDKEQWRQLDSQLKLVTLLVDSTSSALPPPSKQTKEAPPQMAAVEQPPVLVQQEDKQEEQGGEKEHKKKKHRSSAPVVEQ